MTVSVPFLSPFPIEQLEPGVWQFGGAGEGVILTADPSTVSLIDSFDLEDSRLQSGWGPVLHRLTLSWASETDVVEAMLRITPA